MSKLCPMPGLCMTLQENVTIGNNQLCLPTVYNNKITAALGSEKHTYLVISNGVSCEYVQVKVDSADPTKLVMCDRGMEWTTESNFTKGDSVKFDWTASALDDWAECLDDVDEEPFCIKGHTWNAEEQCYEPDTETDGDTTLTLKDCQNQYTLKNIDFTKLPLDGSLILKEGVYKNPCITVDKEGCITCISESSTTDDSLSGGCCCSGKCNGGCETTESSDKLDIIACQAAEPSVDSGYCLWVSTQDGCLYVLCEGVWLSSNLRVNPP